jgi:hypothetical protein
VKTFEAYGSEAWATTEVDVNSLGTWDRKIFRRIHGPVAGQGIGKIRTNQGLREILTI